jgi:predicted HTH transcriptional regulator
MNIDLGDLVDMIHEGKTQEFRYENIEYKRNWDQEYGKKISAIGNRNFVSEYFILIGVEDNGTLSGHNEAWAKATEEKISNHLNQYLSPSLTCLGIFSEEIDNNYIIVIRCKNPGTVIRWNQKGYRANGTTLIILEPHEELEIAMGLPGLEDYSSRKHDSILDENLILESYSRLKDLRECYKDHETEITEKPTKFLDYLKINHTKASYLLYGDCNYRFVVYDKDNNVQSNEEIKGLYNLLKGNSFANLIQIITKTYSYSNITLPEKAYKEGLANAIMHAAYYENNGEIMIEVFNDRIAISNLCYPESIAFANKWFSKSHKTFNRLLGEYLRALKHVDELGLGKNLIFKQSLAKGNPPPEIIIENAERLKRWKLKLYYLKRGSAHSEILTGLRTIYKDDNKAIMALSLILWNKKKVQEIKKYIDDEYISTFLEILSDPHGPVFYYEKEDRLILARWVNIMLAHGQKTKAFSPSEKLSLYSFAYRMHSMYHSYLIAPKELRELARMGNSKSEQTQCSSLFAEWEKESKISRRKHGVYEFAKNEEMESQIKSVKTALN